MAINDRPFENFDYIPINIEELEIERLQLEQPQTNNPPPIQLNNSPIDPLLGFTRVDQHDIPVTTNDINSQIEDNRTNTIRTATLAETLGELRDTVTVSCPRNNIAIILINSGSIIYPWNNYLYLDNRFYFSNPVYRTLADVSSTFDQILDYHNNLHHIISGNPSTLASWQIDESAYQQMSHSLNFNQLLEFYSESYEPQDYETAMVTSEVPRYSTIFTFHRFHNFPSYETFATTYGYGTSSEVSSLYRTLNTYWLGLQPTLNPNGVIDQEQTVPDGIVIHHQVDFSGAHISPFADNDSH